MASRRLPCRALATALGYVCFELLVKFSHTQAYVTTRPKLELGAGLVLLHLAAIWFAVARFSTADGTAVGTEVLRIALLYAALLGTALLARWRACLEGLERGRLVQTQGGRLQVTSANDAPLGGVGLEEGRVGLPRRHRLPLL